MSATTESPPLISVVMAVYNGASYLKPAIDSILQQTYPHFEFIIIDDGSTDSTASILQHHEQLDRRIKVYTQTNQGLPKSLNRGLQLARGQYIARMDADDISLPERFAKQVEFMENHPDVGICGTWIKTLSDTGEGYINQYPADGKAIQYWLLFGTGLSHPTAMFCREYLERYNLQYDPAFTYCQDFELWVRASNHFQLANILEVLLLYRVHPQQMGQSYSQQTRLSENRKVWSTLFARLRLKVTDSDWQTHQALWQFQLQPSRTFVLEAEAWLLKLMTANRCECVYEESGFENYVGDRWFIVCDKARNLGAWMAWKFWFSELTHRSSLTKFEIREFCLDCIKHDIKKLLVYCGLRKKI